MSRFQVYEEYGARYELVQRDLDEVQRTLLSWNDYDRGIEVISSTVNPVKSREANRRKALTVKDLLIKVCQQMRWKHAGLTMCEADSTFATV